ncbi:MAG: putative integral rane protein [Friedmanniella sp.]|nr:putative integral rane protein [Friedmanniella sp.]
MPALRDAAAGAALLARGGRLLMRRPRLFWLGALPPLVTSILFTVVLVLLVTRLSAVVGWLTPFADRWAPSLTGLVRVVVGFGVLGGSVLVMVLLFSTLTLALGSPLYDAISEAVDHECGHPPEPRDERLATGLLRALRQSAVLVGLSVLSAAAFLLVGLIPALGQVAAPVGSACVGGWLLCLELVGSPLERRGRLTLASRTAVLRRGWARVLGLGVPTFLLLSLPFLGVLVFPAATAAGTLLARQLLDEPGLRPDGRPA